MGLKQTDTGDIYSVGHGSEVKVDMKSYIPLETAAIFFLANLFSKTGY